MVQELNYVKSGYNLDFKYHSNFCEAVIDYNKQKEFSKLNKSFKLNCFGKIIYENGEVYYGDIWENSQYFFFKDKVQKDGKGILYKKDGSIYFGDFYHNQMMGKGTLVEADGSSYVGDFYQDFKHGKGMEYDNRGFSKNVGQVTYFFDKKSKTKTETKASNQDFINNLKNEKIKYNLQSNFDFCKDI